MVWNKGSEITTPRCPAQTKPSPTIAPKTYIPQGRTAQGQRAGAAREYSHFSGGSVEQDLSGAGYVKTLARISDSAG